MPVRAVNGSGAGRPPDDRTDLAGVGSLLIIATVAHTIRHFLLPYATHLRALGWRVDAAANGGRADEVVMEAFDHVYDLPLSRSILDIGKIVRAERAVSALLATGPDIVHVHTPIAGFVTRVAVHRAPAERRPAVVYTTHGFHFYEGGNRATNAAFLMAERVAGRWTDRLVVINTEDEAAALRHRIVQPGRLVRMPGIGVDTRWWSPSSVAPADIVRFRDRLSIAAGAPVFLVVGELNRNKRQRDAIAALATMQHKDAQLLLAGQGSEEAHLDGIAREQGVRDRVHFLGFVQDPRLVIRAATALILPSKREGLARSVMEALALEVPVIASAARGNRELIGGDSGILVDVADVQGLAAAMDQLVDRPEQRRSMGLRGRARMVEGYDVEVLLRMHEELYRSLLRERAGRAP